MSKQTYTPKSKSSIDWQLLTPVLIVILLVALLLIFFPEQTEHQAKIIMKFVTQKLSTIYLITAVTILVFSLWLAFGPYGNVKLGAANEPPEYSSISWFSMMISSGVGAGVIIWGFGEPIHYLQTPPQNIEPHSNDAMTWGHMYTLYHWGFIGWAIYALPSVCVAYMLYVKKTPLLRISNTCNTILPSHVNKYSLPLFDILTICCIIGSIATSLGFGVPLVSAIAAEFFNIPDIFTIKLFVIITWIILFSTSVYYGLNKGIKRLANINIIFAAIVALMILLGGPTLFILSLSTNSLGLMINNFALISLWTDPIEKSSFTEAWTAFYWAWWLSVSLFVSLFIGRISRGRTIRQLTLGVTVGGSLGCWAFISIISAYSIHVEVNNLLPVSDILNNGMPILVAKIIASMPMGQIMLIIFAALSFVAYATSIDSAIYLLASISSKSSKHLQEPGLFSRLIWVGLVTILSIGLIISGRLPAIQSISVASSILVIPIIILMCISLIKSLKNDN